MKINVSKNLGQYDGIIIPLFEGQVETQVLDLPLADLKEQKKFEGKVSSLYHMTSIEDKQLKEIVLLGLGDKEKLSFKAQLNAFANAYRHIKGKKSNKIALYLKGMDLEADLVKAAAEALVMADYSFSMKSEEKAKEEIEVTIISDQDQESIREHVILGEANLVGRDLVNQPANLMNPLSLAQRVEELGQSKGFEVEILGKSQIEDLKMDAFMAVAKASAIEPKFIIMRYMGDPDSEDILGYVGKGLTYDSGGLSIKPTNGMVDMKSDMGGSAAVIGAMCAIADMKLKKNVVAVVAACENMIAGNAYRPGDIIGSMGGKTIFIGNTDAEGRLTLIDAMHYIVTKEKVSRVLDIATLTGAAIYCTGSAASAAISTDDDFYKQVDESFALSGEQIWRMPIFDEYKELIKHEEADLTNIAGNPGTVTAGLFIGEFTQNLPWVHIDIAGTAFAKKTAGYISKGGTGVAVRPLYHLAKN